MKKKVVPFLLVVVLLCSLFLLPGQRAQAATVYFMAINDMLYPTKLTDDTMPFISGGMIFVPYTIFSKSSTGVNLGTGCLNSAEKNTISVYSSLRMITFSLTERNAWDQDGNVRNEYAITRQGISFIPVDAVCDFLDLNCSLVNTDLGKVVRVYNSAAVLPEITFASAVVPLLQTRLNEYYGVLTPSPSPTTSTPPTPDSPPPSHPVATRPSVRVSFLVEDAESFTSVLVSSIGYGLYPAFFFRPEDLPAMQDYVRQAIGTGCRVGLWVEGNTAEELDAALTRGNGLLRQAAWTNTRLVYTSSPAGNTLIEAGWCLWPGNVTGRTWTNLLSSIERQKAPRVTLTLDSDAPAMLPSLLSSLISQNHLFTMVRETDEYFN